MRWISTNQMPWLERYLDLAAARHKLVTNNLANIDTPGYAARDINFAAEMQRALADSAPARPEVQEVAGLSTRPDGNNVNLERETALLAETQIRFQLGVQLLRMQFQKIRNTIQEGRGV